MVTYVTWDILQIIQPSFFLQRKIKAVWRATLSLLSIFLCHSHFLTVSLSHSHSLTHKHTPSYLYFVSIVCIYCIYFWNMSNNQRVFDDPSKVRGHMTSEISNALRREAKVRQILINLLTCLWKSLLILYTICLFVGCSCCWSMMFYSCIVNWCSVKWFLLFCNVFFLLLLLWRRKKTSTK